MILPWRYRFENLSDIPSPVLVTSYSRISDNFFEALLNYFHAPKSPRSYARVLRNPRPPPLYIRAHHRAAMRSRENHEPGHLHAFNPLTGGNTRGESATRRAGAFEAHASASNYRTARRR